MDDPSSNASDVESGSKSNDSTSATDLPSQDFHGYVVQQLQASEERTKAMEERMKAMEEIAAARTKAIEERAKAMEEIAAARTKAMEERAKATEERAKATEERAEERVKAILRQVELSMLEQKHDISRIKAERGVRALSTQFFAAVDAAKRKPARIPFSLKLNKQRKLVKVAWKDLEIQAPLGLNQQHFTLGQDTLESERDLVQPIATQLFCKQLRQLGGQNIRYACVDIHTGPSNYIWQHGTPDLLLCHHTGRSPLAVEMMNSSNAALIVENKSSKTLDQAESLPQLIAYMETFLMKSPLRRHVFGLLTDLYTGVLVKVTRQQATRYEQETFQYTVYERRHGQALVDLIFAILQQDPSVLDAGPVTLEFKDDDGQPEQHDFYVYQHLGHGISGDVLAIKSIDGELDLAVKGLVPGRVDVNLTDEMTTMGYVSALDNKYLGCNFWPATKISGQNTKLIALQRCEQLTPDAWPFEHIEGVIDALKLLHQRGGMIHRDMRPSNILVLDGHPVIIDFGCAIQVGGRSEYQGSVCYGACMFDDERRQLQEQGKALTFGPADDLISFVLTMFAIFFTQEGDIECVPEARVNISAFWRSRLPRTWLDAIHDIQAKERDGDEAYTTTLRFLEANLGQRPLWCQAARSNGTNWDYGGVSPRKRQGTTYTAIEHMELGQPSSFGIVQQSATTQALAAPAPPTPAGSTLENQAPSSSPFRDALCRNINMDTRTPPKAGIRKNLGREMTKAAESNEKLARRHQQTGRGHNADTAAAVATSGDDTSVASLAQSFERLGHSDGIPAAPKARPAKRRAKQYPKSNVTTRSMHKK